MRHGYGLEHSRQGLSQRARQVIVAVMEAVFIGLLCYFDQGAESPFRYYYFLSLLVFALRCIAVADLFDLCAAQFRFCHAGPGQSRSRSR